MSLPMTTCHFPPYFYSITLFNASSNYTYSQSTAHRQCWPQWQIWQHQGWRFSFPQSFWTSEYWISSHSACTSIIIFKSMPFPVPSNPRPSNRILPLFGIQQKIRIIVSICVDSSSCVHKLKFVNMWHLQSPWYSTALSLIEVAVLNHNVYFLWLHICNDVTYCIVDT